VFNVRDNEKPGDEPGFSLLRRPASSPTTRQSEPGALPPGKLKDQSQWIVWRSQCGRQSHGLETEEHAIQVWNEDKMTDPTPRQSEPGAHSIAAKKFKSRLTANNGFVT
jgi:hypothetical protein